MVACKYYRQGNCRYGQYCQYEHDNSFGNGNKNESYNVDEITAVMVAKEVLIAERGGQWLLSSFGPFKERPCIPGMEDLSPEEVRWEIYQAQKNGTIEQAKLHFQQLCQDMKAKREVLKNPTRETVAMLKKVVGTGQKTPQMGLPNSTSSSSVFGNKTFGTQSNPFSGGFNSTNTTSLFGRTNTNTTVFGSTPTFGSNLPFGNTANSNPVFGAAPNTSVFGGVQNTQTFGTPQNNPVFGNSPTQPVFGQPSAFGANQMSNVFARPQTSQSTSSVFDSGGTPSNSLFGTSQPAASLFGPTKTTTTNPFGQSSNLQTTNSVFGTTTSTGNIFGQPKTTAAFGAAPVFGGVTSFANNQSGSIFGGQPTFGNSAISTSNIFGVSNTTTSVFGSGQPANAFGVTATASAPNVFNNVQTCVTNSTPFGTVTSTTNSPFASGTQFDSTSTTTGPFGKTTFGLSTTNTGDTFGTTATTSNSPFGQSTTGPGFTTNAGSPFTTSTFGNQNVSPFTSTNNTVTTTTANLFSFKTQQTNSPFGNVAQNQTTTTTVMPNGPFSKSPFGESISSVIDNKVYSVEGQLTDDEKNMYLAEQFILGKIPLKPPTKDIR